MASASERAAADCSTWSSSEVVEEREGARRRWLYQFDLRTRKRASNLWRLARYFIHTAEFFTVASPTSARHLALGRSRLEKLRGDRCRRRRRGDDEESIASAKRIARVLPADAYVLTYSQPIRDVLCGSADWACPQWGCGASCRTVPSAPSSQAADKGHKGPSNGAASARSRRCALGRTVGHQERHRARALSTCSTRPVRTPFRSPPFASQRRSRACCAISVRWMCAARGAGVPRRSGSGEETGISSVQHENYHELSKLPAPHSCPATLPDG